ncbi:MAG: VWA domain-containing protein [Planctomycetes bacterium]|nr:VWA domain-containing protein [Planctomycetota bacterium]
MNPLDVSFAAPEFLWACALAPLVAWLRHRPRPVAIPFAPFAFARDLPATWRTRLAPWPRVVECVAIALLFAVLARPRASVDDDGEREGIDIVLCLDVSSSMTAKDLDPERPRLAVVKEAAARFVRARADDRIGIVTFARYPDVVSPCTFDHRAVLDAIDAITWVEADGAEDATGIGAAVARSAALLSRSAGRSKVVVLLTDGEENVGTRDAPQEIAPIHAAQLCAELGVRVYAIAAGLGRYAPTVIGAGTFEPIDTRPIQRLATRSGGRFFAARDASALSDVYAEIDALEAAASRIPRRVFEDRSAWFAGLGLVLFALARIVRVRVLEGVA